MLRVLVIGFPRTATAGVYVKLYYKLHRMYDDAICLYEPFNGDYPPAVLKGWKLYHDVMGELPHDYLKLPREVLEFIAENSKWLSKWINQTHPQVTYCGNWMQVIDALDNLPNIVMLKDVYIWPYLPRLAEHLPEAKIAVMVRDLNYVEKSFLKWLKRGKPWRIILSRLLKIHKFRPSKIPRVVETMKRSMEAQNPRNLYSIGIFYRYFYGDIPSPLEKREELLKKMLRRVYGEYLKLVEEAEKFDNVHVVKFESRIADEEVDALVKKLMEF